MKFRLSAFLVISILFISSSFYGYQMYYVPNVLVDQSNRALIIDEGSSYPQLLKKLQQGQYVKDIISFGFMGRLYGLNKKIRSGRFILKRNMTNPEAIHYLLIATQDPVNITFSHARRMTDLGKQITKNIHITPEDFYLAVAQFVDNNQEDFTSDNILSMFLPNTYEVYYDITAPQLVRRMYREYLSFWNSKRMSSAKKIGLSPIEVSILASIVQSESLKTDEASRIAGLYINRLKKKMPLQADPTVVFATGNFNLKRVLNKHKKVDSPYNTYLYKGLPPGPITMPKLALLDAVLQYEVHSYLYMCAKEDFSGYHYFSASFHQHIKYAQRYQRSLSIEQNKRKRKKSM